MKKWWQQSILGFSLLLLAFGLAGCQGQTASPRWPHKSLAHAVENFVVSQDFMDYTAIKHAFSQKGLYMIYPYSAADAKRTGDLRYHVTVRGQVYKKRKNAYATYATFDLETTPHNGKLAVSAARFTKSTPKFNRWLKIQNIKVNHPRVALLNKQGAAGVNIQGIFPDQDGNHINSAYQLFQASFPITSKAELAEYYLPDSGNTKAILTMLNANDWKAYQLPQATQDGMLKGMKTLANAKLNYLRVDRLSQSYYAIALFENATADQAKGLMILKDAAPKDPKLAHLQFVTIKAVAIKMP